MKTLKKGITLLVLALLVSFSGHAQSVARKADEQFKNRQYTLALESYLQAYDRVSTNRAEKNRIYFQIAECYRLTYNYPRAERIYKRLADEEYYKSERKLYFNLAEMCRFQEKFDEADERLVG